MVRLFLSSLICLSKVFFPASTITFQFWWAAILEQSFIEKGIAKAISDFGVFFNPPKKITSGADSKRRKASAISSSSSKLHDPKKNKES